LFQESGTDDVDRAIGYEELREILASMSCWRSLLISFQAMALIIGEHPTGMLRGATDRDAIVGLRGDKPFQCGINIPRRAKRRRRLHENDKIIGPNTASGMDNDCMARRRIRCQMSWSYKRNFTTVLAAHFDDPWII
jgi:hypothetical protein